MDRHEQAVTNPTVDLSRLSEKGASMSRADQSPLTAVVVGCGGAGANHAAGYRRSSDARLVGVCDIDGERATALAEEYDVEAFTDLAELLETLRPDVVSVATPEPYHVEPAVTALESGAHVFCEKIMAHSLAAGREICAAAESAEGYLGVDYNYRHMPSFAAVENAIEDGTIGDPHLASVDVHAFGWHHALDLLRFFFGEPESVRAQLDHDPTVHPERFRMEDVLYVPTHAASAILEFSGGTLATVSSSVHTDLGDHLIDLAVYGDEGRLRLTGMTPADSTGEVAPGPLADDLRNCERITLDEAFERSVGAFVEAIRNGERPPTTGEDGLAVMEIEHAVLESARQDTRVEL